LLPSLDEKVDNRKVFGTSFSIKKDDFVWHGNSGNFSANQSYFIASTTKLFTTAIILKLKADGNLNLDDKVSDYIDDSILAGLHIFKGKEYSARITIKHLLAHTSGLPDYFQGKGANGKSLEDELVSGNDQSWTFEQAIERAKKIPIFLLQGLRRESKLFRYKFSAFGKNH
jgi:D-alanyl-D-alanine carboxypeptidase